MAICIIKKGVGGIQSEDTTAVRADVLVGKTALTADSNDEALEGTMQLQLIVTYHCPSCLPITERTIGARAVL